MKLGKQREKEKLSSDKSDYGKGIESEIYAMEVYFWRKRELLGAENLRQEV